MCLLLSYSFMFAKNQLNTHDRFISQLLILLLWSMSQYVPFCSNALWVYGSIYHSINTKLSWHCSCVALISDSVVPPTYYFDNFSYYRAYTFDVNFRINSSIPCHWNSHCSLLAVENCPLGLRSSGLSWAVCFFQGEEGISPGYGEGNGIPLQYSCLENPMDGGAW